MFSVGGNAGFAIGPLFVAGVLAATGTGGIPVLAVPALITGVTVYGRSPGSSYRIRSPRSVTASPGRHPLAGT